MPCYYTPKICIFCDYETVNGTSRGKSIFYSSWMASSQMEKFGRRSLNYESSIEESQTVYFKRMIKISLVNQSPIGDGTVSQHRLTIHFKNDLSMKMCQVRSSINSQTFIRFWQNLFVAHLQSIWRVCEQFKSSNNKQNL